VTEVAASKPSTSKRPWWTDAVVYQLYVRSFADGGADGIGDLVGIRHRLDHLVKLGVDAIWLNPCYPSPQHDHGYDVSDYFDIEPDYGDLVEFDRLVASAKDVGIKILMDVVPNHCSWDHKWFKEALASPRGSAARGRFYFADGKGADGALPPNNWQAIFGGSAWSRVTEPDGTPGQWYLHVFTPQQPDLNFNHPDVPEMFDRMLTFWFDRGVEGFRADAVTVLGKAVGLPDTVIPDDAPEVGWVNPEFNFRPEGFPAWSRWRALVDGYNARNNRDVFVIAEAYTPSPEIMREYVADDRFHQSFAFNLMLAQWDAGMVRKAVTDVVDTLLPLGLTPAWTLNNHDAHRAVTRYGRADATELGAYTGGNLNNSTARVNVEIGTRRARASVAFEMALPGSIYLYMGEELGLFEVLDLPPESRQDPIWFRTEGREVGRDGCRVPMPWSIDEANNHAFSVGADAAPSWLPQPAGWGRLSVQAQEASNHSTLAMYREALAMRRTMFASAAFDISLVLEDDADLVGFTRGDYLVVMNTGSDARQVPAKVLAGRVPLFVSAANTVSNGGNVPADATVWFGRASA
jgi:alpha-glucosidase